MELLKSLKFLTALCFLVEGLVLQFAPQDALTAGTLLTAVVGVLNLFGIVPELRLKALMQLEEKRINSLLSK